MIVVRDDKLTICIYVERWKRTRTKAMFPVVFVDCLPIFIYLLFFLFSTDFRMKSQSTQQGKNKWFNKITILCCGVLVLYIVFMTCFAVYYQQKWNQEGTAMLLGKLRVVLPYYRNKQNSKQNFFR